MVASTASVTAPAISESRPSVFDTSVSGMATTSVEPSVSRYAAARYPGPLPTASALKKTGSRSVPPWMFAGRSGGDSDVPP